MNDFQHIFNRFCYFLGAILISEMLLQLLIYNRVYWLNMPYIIMFSILYALVASLICSIFKEKAGFRVAMGLSVFSGLLYGAQYLYYIFFKTPLQVFNLTNAGKAAEFAGEAVTVIINNLPTLLVFFMPCLALWLFNKNMFGRIRLKSFAAGAAAAVVMWAAACGVLTITNDDAPGTPYNLYYNDTNVPASQKTLGVLTTMRIDAQRTVFGFSPKDAPVVVTRENGNSTDKYEPNVLDIDFSQLIDNETDQELLNMHNYFAGQTPSYKNEHTGMFKGCNLVFIVAESFYYPMLEHPELYPTLCSMANEGWNFTNFYTPLFNVSTSDGEYAAITGLLPKSGVWSFSSSSNNYLPFVLANQFRNEGYGTVAAYHNHTYTYYDRDKSHPNLGYDYKGVGNGLDVKVTWPESDQEMAQCSVDEYAGEAPFHVYYLTVSGHLEYNFDGNNMAARHRDEVADLSYSQPVKAYLAANIELELMLEEIVAALEESGELENTVFALTADHYPYGLRDECINELVGHKVEQNFELYRNGFFIWKPGLDAQEYDSPMCSLDILPTLSNLFGLDYDSRLLMGRDVFSDTEALAIFNDRSWITERGSYNANTREVTGKMDQAYIDRINTLVHGKFVYSAKILERDYYRVVLED